MIKLLYLKNITKTVLTIKTITPIEKIAYMDFDMFDFKKETQTESQTETEEKTYESKTEIEETVGHVFKEGIRLGIPVPYTEFAYRTVKAIEDNFAGRLYAAPAST